MNKWYLLTKKQIFENVLTSDEGLSTKESLSRLEANGKNLLPKSKQDSVFKIFFNELMDPIVLLLVVAAVSSFLVSEIIDGVAIIFIILIDLIMGTYQENKANNTAASLSKLVALQTRVLRDNKKIMIDSSDLVVGDIVYLESGDKISADLRIIDSSNFTVDESILTGESMAVAKNKDVLKNENLPISEQSNMLFAGTNVVTGRCVAVVVLTGIATEIGKIAEGINNTKEEKSPLTIRIEELSKKISFLVVIVAFIITILLLIKGESMNQIFLSVVALAVSAMPEGLPLALTMALTIASNNMAKEKVVAKKLHSIESLGSCTVIASDKTGTLTVNEQMAKKIVLPNGNTYEVSGVGYDFSGTVIGEDISYASELAFCGVINNEASINKDSHLGDSIDVAFLVLGKKLKIDISKAKVLEKIPYESENKYSAVFYEDEAKVYCTVKGSLEKVISFCKSSNLVSKFDIKKLEKQNEELAASGYRVIALAMGEVRKKSTYTEKDIKNLKFMGMVGFIDPIRKEVVSSIKKCRSAGIKVLMITGDHQLTAFKIAKDLELTNNYAEVTTGVLVDEYLAKGDVEFDKFVKSHLVFTRISPMQKLKIVESLKRSGEFVAVTGDGVNDALALRSANLGIAMGSGTDIAREASKMIVLDDNFKSIVSGILQGRVAYANIRKIIYFLISCGLAEVLFFILSIICNMPMPLLAIQLLFLNVVTDGIQDFALSFEKAEADIMREKPRDPKESLLDKGLFEEILVSGLVIGFLVFSVWFYLINILHMDVITARGYVMIFMIFIQNVHVFNCRSEKNSLFSVPIRNNLMILFGVLGSIFLGILVMEVDFLSKMLQTVSLPISVLGGLFLLSLIIVVVIELYKKIRFHS